MHVTYQMIVSGLAAEHLDIEDYSRAADPTFRGVEIYTGGAARGDILYVTTLDKAAPVDTGEPLTFLCLCEGEAPSTLITKNHIAVVRGDVGVAELANRAGRILSHLNQWVIDMQASVIAGEGVQALLDLSRSFIHNPVVLMDMTCKLLAHSFYGEPDAPEAAPPPGNDFSIEDFTRAWSACPVPEKQTDDAVVHTGPGALPYPTLRKRFRLSGTFSLDAAMLCSTREPSPGLSDLFGLLCEYIGEYIGQGYPYEGKYSAFDSLLHDFLDGRLQEAEDIALRASHASLPDTGLFELYQILLTDTENQPMAYQATVLQGKLPNSRVAFYQKSIVALNLYADENTSENASKGNLRVVREALGGQIQSIGVSNLFFSLCEFRKAFSQAQAALAAGPRGNRADTLPAEGPVYTFEEAYVDHMLLSMGKCEEGIYDGCLARRTLNRLLALEKQQNYNYIGFLYTYLMAERRPSAVSRQLNLHRNTAIYHIHKVEGALECSLENPQTRLKLLLEIKRHLLDYPLPAK